VSDKYLHLRIVHPPNDMAVSPPFNAPLRFAGRNIVLQVVDGEDVLGYLGGVTSVSEHYPLDGLMSLELTVGAFFEAIGGAQWPSPTKRDVPPLDTEPSG
jgi:hypothetical protein